MSKNKTKREFLNIIHFSADLLFDEKIIQLLKIVLQCHMMATMAAAQVQNLFLLIFWIISQRYCNDVQRLLCENKICILGIFCVHFLCFIQSLKGEWSAQTCMTDLLLKKKYFFLFFSPILGQINCSNFMENV